MRIRTLRDVKVRGKRILLRVAYDVPLEEKEGQWVVADDARIRATLPTIEYLLREECSLVILSWLGRPKGRPVEKYRMDPVAKRLGELLGQSVRKLDACVGEAVQKTVESLKPREVVLLENVRFYHEEENPDDHFTKQLAALGDLIVFDAFAQAHRARPSTTGILEYQEAVAGLLVEKELRILTMLLEHPTPPFIAILGGAKVLNKAPTILNLLSKVHAILLGGALVHPFLLAKGFDIETSFLGDEIEEGDRERIVHVAREILEKDKGVPVLRFPRDLVAAEKTEQGRAGRVIDFEKGERIPKGWKFLDLGPKTIQDFKTIIEDAKTIFWNGPMGVFEIESFARGTVALADAVAKSGAFSVIGGGDTEKIISMFHLDSQFIHVSTGGGASLEFLAGNPLPAMKMLEVKS